MGPRIPRRKGSRGQGATPHCVQSTALAVKGPLYPPIRGSESKGEGLPFCSLNGQDSSEWRGSPKLGRGLREAGGGLQSHLGTFACMATGALPLPPLCCFWASAQNLPFLSCGCGSVVWRLSRMCKAWLWPLVLSKKIIIASPLIW